MSTPLTILVIALVGLPLVLGEAWVNTIEVVEAVCAAGFVGVMVYVLRRKEVTFSRVQRPHLADALPLILSKLGYRRASASGNATTNTSTGWLGILNRPIKVVKEGDTVRLIGSARHVGELVEDVAEAASG